MASKDDIIRQLQQDLAASQLRFRASEEKIADYEIQQEQERKKKEMGIKKAIDVANWGMEIGPPPLALLKQTSLKNALWTPRVVELLNPVDTVKTLEKIRKALERQDDTSEKIKGVFSDFQTTKEGIIEDYRPLQDTESTLTYFIAQVLNAAVKIVKLLPTLATVSDLAVGHEHVANNYRSASNSSKHDIMDLVVYTTSEEPSNKEVKVSASASASASANTKGRDKGSTNASEKSGKVPLHLFVEVKQPGAFLCLDAAGKISFPTDVSPAQIVMGEQFIETCRDNFKQMIGQCTRHLKATKQRFGLLTCMSLTFVLRRSGDSVQISRGIASSDRGRPLLLLMIHVLLENLEEGQIRTGEGGEAELESPKKLELGSKAPSDDGGTSGSRSTKQQQPTRKRSIAQVVQESSTKKNTRQSCQNNRAPLRQLQPPLPSVCCRGVSHAPHLELDHVERAELFDERQPCQLGSGNSGETFLGSYRGQLVAVKVAKLEQSAHKVLHKELQTWKHVLRSLTASELRLFARPVAGGTLEGGETFLATELIDGETVEDWQLAWPPEALGDIMHALELLHEYAGMLHGDIEKCNLMFRYPPVPVGQAAGVLIDLGNARTCHDQKAFQVERLALCNALERLPVDISARTALPPIDL